MGGEGQGGSGAERGGEGECKRISDSTRATKDGDGENQRNNETTTQRHITTHNDTQRHNVVYTVYTVYTLYTVYSVFTVYTVHSVYTVYTVYPERKNFGGKNYWRVKTLEGKTIGGLENVKTLEGKTIGGWGNVKTLEGKTIGGNNLGG